MNKFFILILVVAAVFGGCKKDNKEDSFLQQNSVVGTWYLTKQIVNRITRLEAATRTETEYSGKTYFLKLEASGKCSMKLTEEPNGESTYIIDSRLLVTKLEDLYGARVYVIQEVSGNTLKLKRTFTTNDLYLETELTFIR